MFSLVPWKPRRRHRIGGENGVELGVWHQTAFADDFADRAPGGDRKFGDFRCLSVADMGAERGGEGRAPIEQLAGPAGVSRDAADAESIEHAQRLS